MKFFTKFIFILLIFSLVISFQANYPTNASVTAVENDTFFVPMRAGETNKVSFEFKNTSKMQSKIYMKFIQKVLPKDDEEKWFAGSCYIDLHPTQEIDIVDMVIRPGQKTLIPICFGQIKKLP